MKVTLPGLFDLQVNGFGGVDFNAPDLTADRLDDALERMRRTGVTRCLPTLITSSFDRFAASARVLSHSSHPAIAGHSHGGSVRLARRRLPRRASTRGRRDADP